jgi:hypothetical protein
MSSERKRGLRARAGTGRYGEGPTRLLNEPGAMVGKAAGRLQAPVSQVMSRSLESPGSGPAGEHGLLRLAVRAPHPSDLIWRELPENPGTRRSPSAGQNCGREPAEFDWRCSLR